MLPSTLLFLMGSLIIASGTCREFHGWAAFIASSVGSTVSPVADLPVHQSHRPSATAFIMNLEPLVTTILSMLC